MLQTHGQTRQTRTVARERRPAQTVRGRDVLVGVTFSALFSVYLLVHIGGAMHLFG